MAYQYPQALQKLINELSRLPGVGSKAAQRLAFHLISHDRQDAQDLARAIVDSCNSVGACPICGNYTDAPRCPICQDSSRDSSLICVVESVADLISLERSGRFHGRYHVLGGAISPLEGIGPDKLRIDSLLQRCQQGAVQEVIMATNPTVEGEATALYVAKKLKQLGLRVTRLAHGMPVGGNLAFTDEATLDMALSGRSEL